MNKGLALILWFFFSERKKFVTGFRKTGNQLIRKCYFFKFKMKSWIVQYWFNCKLDKARFRQEIWQISKKAKSISRSLVGSRHLQLWNVLTHSCYCCGCAFDASLWMYMSSFEREICFAFIVFLMLSLILYLQELLSQS
jgi:hypothetical protein